jgi:hypothetical protein
MFRMATLAVFLLVSPAIGAEPTPAEALHKALQSPADWSYRQAPLSEVARSLSERYRINVVLDESALHNTRWSPESRLSGRAKAETLGEALSALLAPHELTWSRHSEVVFLTSQDQPPRVSHVYGVAQGTDAAKLRERLLREYRPNLWTREGRSGVASIAAYGKSALVIDHSSADHFAIARKYKDVLSLCVADEAALLPPELARPVDIHFVEAPLTAVVKWPERESKLKVFVDEEGLRDTTIGLDTLISKRLRNVSLATGLDLVLGDHGLAWYHERGVVWIVTREEQETRPVACAFDVRGTGSAGR